MRATRGLLLSVLVGLGLLGPRPDLLAEPPATLIISVAGDQALRGFYGRRQALATAESPGERPVDATHRVEWSVEPENLARIAPDGWITPLADGEITITARWPGPTGPEVSTRLRLEGIDPAAPIHFDREIVPLFTRHGCNGGGCHGKSGGQNGFRLSLLGFYPADDHDYLVKESRGRRLFTAAPERSLLLLKGTGTLPHEGGPRLERGSRDYELIRDWIRQGMPRGETPSPRVVSVEVTPERRRMLRDETQQLRVLARFEDGRVEDVTRQSLFEPNDSEMASVTPEGLVRVSGRTGSVGIMVRYAGNVGVFRATVPLGAPIESLPPRRNLIDEIVLAKLVELGLPPSPLADDATFIRRVTLDLAGRIPTESEIREFLAESEDSKRERLVERLLESLEHAEFFANKWSNILRNKRARDTHARGTIAFHRWIRDQIHRNLPYDQFARSIIAATGDVETHPPVAWYRSVRTVEEQVEDSAQLFLGTRIQCARCHHHPFEVWSQEDYYSYAAFFSRVGRKEGRRGLNTNDEPRIVHRRGKPSARNPRTGQNVSPAELGGETLEIAAHRDPREALVDWMVRPDNRFFAPALVNRTWKHFFGRGLVEPEDDLRLTNPPSNPELLEGLSRRFIEKGFDLRDLLRTICNSSVYQLASTPNEHNGDDRQNHSRFFPRRLPAEVLYDALNLVTTGRTGGFPGLPPDTRAVALPDGSINNYFLTVFGRPQGDSACECERSQDSSLAQCLHLLNSKDLQQKIASDSGRAARLAADSRPLEERLEELYLWAFARPPEAEEVEIARAYLEQVESPRRGFEDLVWALINTKEFLFNH